MKTVWLVTILMLPLYGSAKKNQTDLEKDSLKGKVKIIRYSYATWNNSEDINKISLDTNYYFVDSFSSKGYRVAKYLMYYGKRTDIYRINYVFDAKGNVIEENNYNYEDGRAYRKNFKYDSNKNIVEETNGETLQVTFKYGPTGKIIEERHFDDNDLIKMVSNKYDSSLLVLKNDSSSSGIAKTIYSYSKNGNITIVTETVYDVNGEESTVIYTYGSDNKIISEHRPNSNISIIYKYDDRQNLIRRGAHDGIKEVNLIYAAKYVYDKLGNWILRATDEREMIDTSFKRVTIREIIYYN